MDAGAAGVPAGTPLQADLTLLSWKHVEDLSGDGGVIKKTLHDPEGWQVGESVHNSCLPLLHATVGWGTCCLGTSTPTHNSVY